MRLTLYHIDRPNMYWVPMSAEMYPGRWDTVDFSAELEAIVAEHGPDVFDSDCRPLLTYAICEQKRDVVQYLIAHGARLKYGPSKPNRNTNPLDYAAATHNLGIITDLMNAGVNYNDDPVLVSVEVNDVVLYRLKVLGKMEQCETFDGISICDCYNLLMGGGCGTKAAKK